MILASVASYKMYSEPMFENKHLQIFIIGMLIGCVYFLARLKLDTAYKHRLGQSMQYGVVFSFLILIHSVPRLLLSKQCSKHPNSHNQLKVSV